MPHRNSGRRRYRGSGGSHYPSTQPIGTLFPPKISDMFYTVSKALIIKNLLLSSKTERTRIIEVIIAMQHQESYDELRKRPDFQFRIDTVRESLDKQVIEDYKVYKGRIKDLLATVDFDYDYTLITPVTLGDHSRVVDYVHVGLHEFDIFTFLERLLPASDYEKWEKLEDIANSMTACIYNYRDIYIRRRTIINAAIIAASVLNGGGLAPPMFNLEILPNVKALKKAMYDMDYSGILCNDIIYNSAGGEILNFNNIDANTAAVLKAHILSLDYNSGPTIEDTLYEPTGVTFQNEYSGYKSVGTYFEEIYTGQVVHKNFFLDESYPVKTSIKDIVNEKILSINAIRREVVRSAIQSIEELPRASFLTLLQESTP